MESVKQIPGKHWRVTPGVTEIECDCEEWMISGRKCSTKHKRQSGLSWQGRLRERETREREREMERWKGDVVRAK